MMQEFKLEAVSRHLRRIVLPCGVCVYLVQGTQGAVLLDTGFGIGDLRGFVERQVTTPYQVWLSHGHLDHAGGAAQFEEVFLSPEDRIAIFGDACGEMTLLKREALPGYAEALRRLRTREDAFDTVLRNHGIFWSDKRILRDNLALTEDILAGRDAAIPLQMMGVPGFAGRPQEHPGTYGNIFYAAAKDARW